MLSLMFTTVSTLLKNTNVKRFTKKLLSITFISWGFGVFFHPVSRRSECNKQEDTRKQKINHGTIRYHRFPLVCKTSRLFGRRLYLWLGSSCSVCWKQKKISFVGRNRIVITSDELQISTYLCGSCSWTWEQNL